MRRTWVARWMALAVLILGCSGTMSYVPRIGAISPLIPDSLEDRLGEQIQKLPPQTVDVLGAWAYGVKLKTVKVAGDRFRGHRKRVTTTMNRLITSAKGGEHAKAAGQFNWKTTLIRKDVPNAFALPGGKVGVYTGLFQVLEQDDDMLAAVLGHEMAHALARHAAERMDAELVRAVVLVQTPAQLKSGGLNSGENAAVMVAMGLSSQTDEILPFSREHESEADQLGLMLMADAGYDPRGAVRFWTKMKKLGVGEDAHVSELISAHPSTETRITQIEKWLPEAQAHARKSHDPDHKGSR